MKAKLKVMPRKKAPKPIAVTMTYTDRAKLLKFPWPWADESVETFNCMEIFQYVPGKQRLRFMEELYRVLSPAGTAVILAGFYSCSMSIADYEVEWPPVCEQSFLFFNRKWREANGIAVPMKCDFDFTYGYAWAPETVSRNQETQAEWVKYRLNAAQKVQVNLTKVKSA